MDSSVAVRLEMRRMVDRKNAICSDLDGPTRTHSSNGYYGNCIAPGQAFPPATTAQQEKIIAQATIVYYFYNMNLIEDMLLQISHDHRILITERSMKNALEKRERVLTELEEQLWGNLKSLRTKQNSTSVCCPSCIRDSSADRP